METFTFFAGGNDTVCINSLHIDNKQIFFGKKDNLTSFILQQETANYKSLCSEIKLRTPSLTIQNEEEIQSQCKGIITKSDITNFTEYSKKFSEHIFRFLSIKSQICLFRWSKML